MSLLHLFQQCPNLFLREQLQSATTPNHNQLSPYLSLQNKLRSGLCKSGICQSLAGHFSSYCVYPVRWWIMINFYHNLSLKWCRRHLMIGLKNKTRWFTAFRTRTRSITWNFTLSFILHFWHWPASAKKNKKQLISRKL